MTTRVTSFSISSAGPVELLVDLARQFARHAGDRLELLPCSRQEPLRRAEVLEQRALANRPHPPQLVEHRAGHRPVAAAAMMVDRETVGLVTNPLQELR